MGVQVNCGSLREVQGGEFINIAIRCSSLSGASWLLIFPLWESIFYELWSLEGNWLGNVS